MTIFGMGVRAAMLAGALAFAGTASAGDDKTHSSSTQSEASEGMKPGSASGLGTTGQQDRSSTTAGASGQSESTETSGKSSGMSSAQASNELTGRVEKFDHDSKTFTVAGKDLKIDSSTKVMKDGEKAELTDIKEGDEIRASYSGSGDTLTADRIEVMPKSGMSSGASSSTPELPAGRAGDSAGTTSGTGTGAETPSSTPQGQGEATAQPGGNK
jgi:Cu/Ag efflux protein CusF